MNDIICNEIMNWKELLKQLTRDFRMSEAEIARITGITYPTLNRIGRGITEKPNQNTIKMLESGLNIKINDSNPDDISYEVVPSVVRENPEQYLTITQEEKALIDKLKELGITTIEQLDQLYNIEDIAEDLKEVLKKKILNKK